MFRYYLEVLFGDHCTEVFRGCCQETVEELLIPGPENWSLFFFSFRELLLLLPACWTVFHPGNHLFLLKVMNSLPFLGKCIYSLHCDCSHDWRMFLWTQGCGAELRASSRAGNEGVGRGIVPRDKESQVIPNLCSLLSEGPVQNQPIRAVRQIMVGLLPWHCKNVWGSGSWADQFWNVRKEPVFVQGFVPSRYNFHWVLPWDCQSRACLNPTAKSSSVKPERPSFISRDLHPSVCGVPWKEPGGMQGCWGWSSRAGMWKVLEAAGEQGPLCSPTVSLQVAHGTATISTVTNLLDIPSWQKMGWGHLDAIWWFPASQCDSLITFVPSRRKY